eukprot:4219194-Amphidinium_carterae.2
MATPVDRKKPQFQRQHMVRDGRYTHNRRGLELCKGFQENSCTHTVFGNKCARNTSLQWCTSARDAYPLIMVPLIAIPRRIPTQQIFPLSLPAFGRAEREVVRLSQAEFLETPRMSRKVEA